VRNSPILAEIAAAIPSLRKSEVKVAEYVLRAPQQVMHMRIVDLAQEAQVSDAFLPWYWLQWLSGV